MADDKSNIAQSSWKEELEVAWDPAANPAVAGLLDHLAEELAMEYVRLMEHAAEEDAEVE